MKEIAAIDFFVVPTLTFRLLFGFIVLRHDRRELVHINVTDHPTAEWTAQQIVDAFPYDAAPRYLLRDRDATYGAPFTRRVAGLGMRELLIAARPHQALHNDSPRPRAVHPAALGSIVAIPLVASLHHRYQRAA